MLKNNRPGRTMWVSRGVLAIAVALLGWAGFGWFEPMLVWSSGWQPLPQFEDAPSTPAVLDESWRRAGEEASARLREARRKLGAPAVSAAVSLGGVPVWAEAIGLADIESGRPVSTESQFRLGSSSKAVTSLAIGTLLDAGAIDLELPVGSYVRDLEHPLAGITTRQALSHTAGVRNYGWCFCFPVWEHLNRRQFSSVRAGLRVFETDPLIFAPGERFEYSSFGFNVAGAVFEAIAGQPFFDALDAAVFVPLATRHTGGDRSDRELPDRVSFYETDKGEYKRAFAVDNSIRYPSGGLLSTPLDMVRLGHSTISDDLLSAETRKVLLTPQSLADGSANPEGYALGWRVGSKELFDGAVKTEIISHHGTAIGSTSYFAVLPEFDLVISVMMNEGEEDLGALAPEATRLIETFVAAVRAAREPSETELVAP